MQCELLWFFEIVQPHLLSGGQGGNAGEHKDTQDKDDPFATSDLHELLNATVERARQRGIEKLDDMKAKALAISLQAGAGQAHRAVNLDNALPPLRLVVESETKHSEGKNEKSFIADPQEVAKHHATPLAENLER